jgi:YVTN family beta-propeller protein
MIGARDPAGQGRSDARNCPASHGTLPGRPRSVACGRGPDGKAIYALNSQTSDVTIIDGVTGEIIRKVPAGGFAVHFMPAASVALVPSASAVHAVDLATHDKQADLIADATGNFASSALSPDARTAVIYGSGGVVIVDATSGKPVATMKAFRRVAAVEIDWSAER